MTIVSVSRGASVLLLAVVLLSSATVVATVCGPLTAVAFIAQVPLVALGGRVEAIIFLPSMATYKSVLSGIRALAFPAPARKSWCSNLKAPSLRFLA